MGTGEYKTYFEEKNESRKPMTNAEKYLKDNIKENDFADMCVYLTRYFDNKISMQKVAEFFKEQVKPTLTEDERVILRNIPKKYTKIRRSKYAVSVELGMNYGTLEIVDNDGKYWTLCVLSHLFQFIKERRRILNTKIIRR